MKIKLPLLVDRSVAEARVTRTELAESYGVQLKSRLAEEGTYVVCRKGCTHCCYHPVFLTLLEGISLFQWLSENGKWTQALKAKFEEVSQKTRNLAPEVWTLSLIACPLLGQDGLCGAYEGRPFACRVTYSIGDPEECHPHRLGPGMLPKRELFEMLTTVEAPLLRRHYLGHFRLPMTTAVLYGEKITKGELELEDCRKALWEGPDHA